MNRGFANIAIVIALVVIVAGGVGYWALTQSQTASPVAETPTLQEVLNTDTEVTTESSPQQTAQPSQSPSDTGTTNGLKTYVSEEYGFKFDYPTALTVKPVQTRELQLIQSAETVPLPAGSLEIAGYFIVSPVKYSEFSEEKPIYDYHSCCSGIRYWYDAAKNQWQANTIQAGRYDAEGNPIPDPKDPFPLSSNGMCSLEQKFGSNTFYKIESGDEGVPTDVYYFLPTNRGYAIRFLTQYDVRGDYSTYAEAYRPDPEMLQTVAQVLSSVTSLAGTSAVKAGCL